MTDPGVDDPQATNAAGWFTLTYTYSATIPHAVTSVNPETGSPDTYTYDANGNMTCRVEGGITFKQDYNAENRISAIHKMNGDCTTGTATESWLYGYDGDGARVTTAHYMGVTLDSMTLYYMGGMYEVTGSVVKKYYSIAGQTVAMNDGSGLKYLLTDHLGSTSAVLDANGTQLSQQRYLPFGEVRTIPNSPIIQTDFGYTFQRNLTGMGLMDYRARFYSQSLGRFIQPDTIIPNPANPQAFNRFSYVLNRPINFNDPTGHCGEGSVPSEGVSQTRHEWLCTLREKAMELSLSVNEGEIKDVEALAQMIEFAAPHYVTRYRGPRGGYTENRTAMANDLGIVLGGNEFTPLEGAQTIMEDHGGFWGAARDLFRGDISPGEMGAAARNRCNNSNYSPDDMCQYYTDFSAFVPEESGFRDEYAEEGSNQVAHFGGGLSALANGGEFGLEAARSGENPTSSDYNLYGAALNLWRSNTRLNGWGNWIREHLAE